MLSKTSRTKNSCPPGICFNKKSTPMLSAHAYRLLISNVFWKQVENYPYAEVESRTQGSRPRPRTQKKIRGQGQGQPFRGQTLSRPRTGMLEAKAKDQGHKAQVLSKKKKKKGLHKNFSGDLQKKKKGLHKNFSSDLHEKTLSKKFFNRSTKF